MFDRNKDNVTIQEVPIGFLNFGGNPDKFNPKGGRRYFSIFLTDEQARELEAKGWNVKWPRDYDHEADARQPSLKITVHYSERSKPRVVLITDRGRQGLPEDLIDIIDTLDIQYADVTFRPYDHQMNGGGRTAYLKSIFVVMQPDELDRKWAHLPEINEDPRALPSGGSDDFIDGDVLDSYEHRELGR